MPSTVLLCTGCVLDPRLGACRLFQGAKHHKLPRPRRRQVGRPSAIIDTEARWDQTRQLLHDDTLKPEDRVAGLFVLLYAQRAAILSRLSVKDIQISDQQVRIRFGREPILLPEPLAALVHILIANRSGARRSRGQRNLAVAVPRRTTWTADHGRIARQMPTTVRPAIGPSPQQRALPARHRTTRSPPGQNARVPHQCRGRLATCLRRGLGQLRRRLQSPPQKPPTNDPAHNGRKQAFGELGYPTPP